MPKKLVACGGSTPRTGKGIRPTVLVGDSSVSAEWPKGRISCPTQLPAFEPVLGLKKIWRHTGDPCPKFRHQGSSVTPPHSLETIHVSIRTWRCMKCRVYRPVMNIELTHARRPWRALCVSLITGVHPCVPEIVKTPSGDQTDAILLEQHDHFVLLPRCFCSALRARNMISAC